MSVSKVKREAIQRAIRAKHCSYSCIAERYGVSIEEVRKIGKPIQHKWWQERKAKNELDRIVEEAEYDRKTYEQPSSESCVYGLCARVVGMFLLACFLIAIGSVAIGVTRWALGV